jgi:hypothetical protein
LYYEGLDDGREVPRCVASAHCKSLRGPGPREPLATSQRCVLWKSISNQWVLSMLAVINGHFVWALQGSNLSAPSAVSHRSAENVLRYGACKMWEYEWCFNGVVVLKEITVA